jgi:magnesium and cobalt exporter, CNNM family
MNIDAGVFISAIVLFLWLMSAWDALIQLSGGRARRIEAKNRLLAKKVEEWVENRSAYDTVFRFLVFLTVCFLAVSMFLFVQDRSASLRPQTVVVILASTAFVFILLGEIVSRVFVFRFDITLLQFTMPLIRLLRYSILFPMVFLTELLKDKTEDRQAREGDDDKTTTEDEILSLVDQDVPEGEDSTALEEDERRMIRGVFELDNTAVREIMTPRVDVKALPIESSIDDAIKLITESGHSRVPVFEGSVDDIKGIIYAKDFLNRKNIEEKTLASLARRPIFVPETKEVGDLLEDIQKSRRHFAVVIDEYGGTAGIVTLEDIIEEIVGEIRDEYDHNEDDTPMHVSMPDGSVVFDARTLVSDVNELLDAYIPEGEEVDTIGGFVCAELGHIPEPEEELEVNDGEIKIKVLKADNKRILTLRITKESIEDD